MNQTVWYKFKKYIFRFIGDIKWTGVRHPLWFVINAKTFQLKGKHYRKVEPLIKPGDIVIRRFEGYVDKWLIPGWWNHAGLYIGPTKDGEHKVVHAISDGVIIEDLIDFMRTDHMIVLRAPCFYRGEAIERAKKAVGSEYDFAFEFSNKLRFSCTELIGHCYDTLIIGDIRFGRETIIADDIINSPGLKVVWDSRKDG